jgi:hypothetical protein
MNFPIERHPEAQPDTEVCVAPEAVVVLERSAVHASSEALHLKSCAPSETILVHTRCSVYELIVVRGDRGEVLVRGGKMLPEFRRATFMGSSAGGTALKPNTIDVGLRMEFNFGGEIMVTSVVREVAREDAR